MSDPVITDSPAAPAPTPAPTPPPVKVSDELPEWARKQISDANQEAANYRVQLKTAKDLLASVQEQVSSLTTEKTQVDSSLNSVQADFDKLATAVQVLLPDNPKVFTFAKTLQGSTEAELTAHAAELKTMFNVASSAAVDRSQGQGAGSVESSPGDVFAALLKSNLTR
jgi:chromosome segregation ATPase